jgi:transcriptional regulator with XRE-family HTH domain
MGPKLNPDGAKIRALRIQRGWTQEQLAEIAGLSARTIQRAETAGCAAFETLRAVAVAFEADFDQLLVSETPEVNQAQPPQLPQPPPPAPACRQPVEEISVARQARSVPRTWTTLQVGTAALVAALLTGVILTYRLETPAGLRLPATRLSPAVVAGTDERRETRNPEVKPSQSPALLQTARNAATRTAVPLLEPGPFAQEPEYPNLSAQAGEPSPSGDLPSSTRVPSFPQPTSLDLPLQSKKPLEFPDIHMPPGGWDTLSMAPGADLSQDDPDTGVVRQALGQAAKKTGGCFAKVGASMRWAF